MTTVQIIGIAVASVAVLLLIVALLVSRRGSATETDDKGAAGSFLGDAPQDTFADLGRADQPVEDVTVDPGVRRAAAETTESATGDDGLGLEWGPGPELEPGPAASEAPADQAGEEPTLAEDAEPAEVAHPTPPAHEDHLVPLSDIIVTTSNKMVDLQDTEVRRMLTDLVTYEIDQAAEFRRQGQTIDAVLQLTEAEKVSRALGMRESADRIRAMMEEIRNHG